MSFEFWNAVDLEYKLVILIGFDNRCRTHASLDDNTHAEISGDRVTQNLFLFTGTPGKSIVAVFSNFRSLLE